MLTSALPSPVPDARTAATQRATLAAGGDALAPAARRGATAAGFSLTSGATAAPAADRLSSRATPASVALRGDETVSPAREPGAQRQVGRLQQGLDYLDRLDATLRQLKGELSGTLARQAPAGEALLARTDQLRELWAQRAAQAGGRVDAQLEASAGPGTEARQRFKLRGLDLAVLTQGGRETLRLQLPGQPADEAADTAAGRPVALAVTLDGEGTEAQLRTLAKVLSPAGLTVQAQGGDLVFSVAESRWPALRDGLTMRGEGRRFPSGQPVRAWLEPAAEALSPQRWSLQDAAGQRQALGQLLQAQPKLAQARATLDGQLQAAARHGAGGEGDPTRAPTESGPASSAAAVAGSQAQALAGTIRAGMDDASFAELGALLPALRGLQPSRVRQLLSTR